MSFLDVAKHQRQFFDVISNSAFATPAGTCTAQDWLTGTVELLESVRARKGRVFLAGNGASQAMASHYAADLSKNALVPALTLSDPAMVTCFSNDYSYADAIREMYKRHFRAEDVMIGISSSGSSKNILNAAEYALGIGGKLITLSGFKPENPLRALSGLSCHVPVSDYGFVECAHTYFLHVVLDGLCERLR